MNNYIQLGCITSIKNDGKDIYIVTKISIKKKKKILFTFYSSKNPEKNYHSFH